MASVALAQSGDVAFNFPDPPREGARDYFPVAEKGQARCVMVHASGASREEVRAASFLRDYLRLVTGANIPLASEDQQTPGGNRAEIHVGETRRARKVPLTLPDVRYGEAVFPNLNGFLVATPDERTLVLRGANPAALHYAVAGFLRRYAGVRSYWQAPPGDLGDVIASRPTLSVPEVVWRDWPYVYNRHLSNLPLRGGKFQLLNPNRTHPMHPGHELIIPVSENYSQWLPPRQYREERPEFFPYMDGRRQIPAPGQKTRWQPCVSNPEVQRIMAENVVAWFEANPHAVGVNFALNDGMGNCMCADCRALDAPGADYSITLGMTDRYVHLSNQVARRLEQRFANRYLSFLAYQGTRRPPVREIPHHNLIPVIAIGSQNNFYELWQAWEQTGLPHLGIYDYQADYRLVFPPIRPRHAARRLKHALKSGRLRSYYSEARPQWPLSGIVTHIVAELLWDPRRDVEQILDEYFTSMYAPADAEVRSFYDALEGGYERALREHGVAHPSGHDGMPWDSAYGAWGQFAPLTPEESILARTALDAAVARADRENADEKVRLRLALLDIAFRLQQMGAEYYWTLREMETPERSIEGVEATVDNSRRLLRLGREMARYFKDVIDHPPASDYALFNSPLLRGRGLIAEMRAGTLSPLVRAAIERSLAAAAENHLRLVSRDQALTWWRSAVQRETDPRLEEILRMTVLLVEDREQTALIVSDFDRLAQRLDATGLGEFGSDIELDQKRIAWIAKSPADAGHDHQGFGQIWFPDRSSNRRVLSTDLARSGRYSLMYEHCHRLRFTRHTQSEGGARCRADFYFRHNDSPGKYRLEILADVDGGDQDRRRATLLEQDLGGHPDRWQKVSAGFRLPGEKGDKARIQLNLFINGQSRQSRCWIDKIRIAQYVDSHR